MVRLQPEKLIQHYQVRKVFTTTWISGLTFLAGTINVSKVFLLKKTISHYTGSLSKAAIAIVDLQFQQSYDLLSYVLLFFIGPLYQDIQPIDAIEGLGYCIVFIRCCLALA